MTKGTMKRDGGQKYDGKRRGWAKFDTRMSNECLGNELLEQLWAGTDVNLPEGTSEAQRTAFSTRWFAAKFLDLSEKMQKQFVKEQTLKVQIRLAKISWFKKMDNSTIGAANTEINKLKWTKIYQARRVLHNLYGANQDTSIRWMEKGLGDACFWDPPNSDYENADFTERDANNKVDENSNMRHFYMGIEKMTEILTLEYPNQQILPDYAVIQLPNIARQIEKVVPAYLLPVITQTKIVSGMISAHHAKVKAENQEWGDYQGEDQNAQSLGWWFGCLAKAALVLFGSQAGP